MAQILYNVKVFYLDKNKHYSVWHNCNTNGVHKIKLFAHKKGIAYCEFYKPKTTNTKPLFCLYFTNVYNVTIHFFDKLPIKKFGVYYIDDVINEAKQMKAKSISIYNVTLNKFDCTIHF